MKIQLKEDHYYGFTHHKRMDYSDIKTKYVDKIVFGIYVENDGCISEASIIWEELCGVIVPYIRIFDDGIRAGYSDNFIAVATELLDVENPTPEQVCEILKKHGFRDDSDKPINKK